jgi:hypothetical protein
MDSYDVPVGSTLSPTAGHLVVRPRPASPRSESSLRLSQFTLCDEVGPKHYADHDGALLVDLSAAGIVRAHEREARADGHGVTTGGSVLVVPLAAVRALVCAPAPAPAAEPEPAPEPAKRRRQPPAREPHDQQAARRAAEAAAREALEAAGAET